MTAITLHGFNNLTKNLSFTLYKLHYLKDTEAHKQYKAYISEKFNATKLTALLTTICQEIGGNVLNIAKQDYKPHGASVTLMISEEAQPQSLVAHLDKSHLCIHSYPDDAPQEGIAIFRADIELSTCGVISPLKVLNYVIEELDADIVDIDYRIRGMTRNQQGKKLYIDEEVDSISNHLSPVLIQNFVIENYNLPQQNLFHSKLCRKESNIQNYLFSSNELTLEESYKRKIMAKIQSELQQLFSNCS